MHRMAASPPALSCAEACEAKAEKSWFACCAQEMTCVMMAPVGSSGCQRLAASQPYNNPTISRSDVFFRSRRPQSHQPLDSLMVLRGRMTTTSERGYYLGCRKARV